MNSNHVSNSPCLPVILPPCLPFVLPPCLPVILPPYLPVILWIPVILPPRLMAIFPCLPVTLPPCLPVIILPRLLIILPPWLPVILPTCLLVIVPSCLLVILPPCLPVILPHFAFSAFVIASETVDYRRLPRQLSRRCVNYSGLLGSWLRFPYSQEPTLKPSFKSRFYNHLLRAGSTTIFTIGIEIYITFNPLSILYLGKLNSTFYDNLNFFYFVQL